jgi:hypothetical protein
LTRFDQYKLKSARQRAMWGGRKGDVVMMPGALTGIFTVGFVLEVAPWVLAILIGFYAKRIFKSRLYGRITDIVIAPIGGFGGYVLVAGLWSL